MRIITFILVLFIAGCTRTYLTPLAYVRWVEEEANGLLVKKQIGKYEFSVQYKTPEYVVLMEEKNEHITADELNKRKQGLEGMEYYTFRISSLNNKEILADNISHESEYYARLEYFMSPMQDDISLVEGKDTIACALFHFERTYGVTPYCNFVMGFPAGKSGIDKKIVYNDRVFGNGPVILNIAGSDINNIPQLTTYK